MVLLTTFVIVVGALLGVVAAFLLGRDVKLKPRWRYVSVFVMIVGIAVTIYGSRGLTHALDENLNSGTNVVKGRILDSHVEGDRAYHAVVIYRFELNGTSYIDTAYPIQPSFGGRSRRLDVAQKNAAQYIPGDTVRVFYEPGKPHESTIERHIYWAHPGALGTGGVLVGLGVCLLLAMARFRPSEHRARD